MLPIFIGAIKSSTVQHGDSFNIAGFGGILNAPGYNQKIQAGQLNNGDFNPSMNVTPLLDADGIDHPSGIIKGF
ncbi:hypothetical protein [Neobacillus fumarioli]|uniref:hypothetical protein n=1 Tax=Neobacillus fumarioli TaxID=105229 RepID=UPI00082BDFF4|nr:hypothetical protein [Neobacillus fumarioli]